jgi:hypothetical protein
MLALLNLFDIMVQNSQNRCTLQILLEIQRGSHGTEPLDHLSTTQSIISLDC